MHSQIAKREWPDNLNLGASNNAVLTIGSLKKNAVCGGQVNNEPSVIAKHHSRMSF
jgi:hypothetical protein